MKNRRETLLLLLIIFSLFFFLRNDFFVISQIQGIIQKTIAPPARFLYKIKTGVASLSDDERLEALKQENKRLLEKLVEYEKLKADNRAFRSQFNDMDTKKYSLVATHVVGFLGRYDNPHTLVIDKGRIDGVVEGAAVVLQKTLVGRISRSGPVFSQVMLPTHSDFSLVVKTAQDSAQGVLRGEGDFMLMDRILITDEVKRGDEVVTRGEIEERGSGVPPDFLIGTVTAVNRRETKPFQTAKVEKALDYARVTLVFVVKRL